MQFNNQTTSPSLSNQHWSELRIHGNLPERRSYHSSFVYDNKLYIYGGLDIQNGSVNTLWELDLGLVPDLDSEDQEKRLACSWRQVPQQGKLE